VPLLVASQPVTALSAGCVGLRQFADVGASIAAFLGVPAPGAGVSFL